MDEFKKPYTIIFNAVTDALELLEKGDISAAKAILQAAQCSAEDAYIEFKS